VDHLPEAEVTVSGPSSRRWQVGAKDNRGERPAPTMKVYQIGDDGEETETQAQPMSLQRAMRMANVKRSSGSRKAHKCDAPGCPVTYHIGDPYWQVHGWRSGVGVCADPRRGDPCLRAYLAQYFNCKIV
jgi:hypothetical protein